MNIIFPDFKLLTNASSIRLKEAKRISRFVKVDYITPKHIGFTVSDPVTNSPHSVIYFSEKKFPKCWNCDCKWFSIKSDFCRHIISVFFRLDDDKSFLKKFPKTKLKDVVEKNVGGKTTESKDAENHEGVDSGV